MRTVRFSKRNHSANILHIETEGCIVNIQVNLHDVFGNEITSVEVIKDWGAQLPDFHEGKAVNIRVICPKEG